MLDSRQIIRRLTETGFALVSVRGSHHKYRHADGRIVIRPHPRKDSCRHSPFYLSAGGMKQRCVTSTILP
ncbi:type II toxin-antitoxin system HicA family toxin [Devosia oryzisoli]|uniref:type II toxin-antitoxin system HicA family toxin n=1 Tax=Devosia oryzisoli TaxID=2774138 RepID=UPI0031F51FD3